jgi:Phage Tail Collar Domain
MAEISNLDPIDVNNIGRFPENMQFRNVNDGGRALEGLLARWFKDTNCSLAASGTNNAYAVTANRVLSAYSDSLIVGFTPNHTNTGAATLNVSGLGAKTIVRPNGDTALAGDIVNGSKVLVIYVQSPVDKFLLLSMPATSASISLAVGAVMAWPTENIPAGCLLADGSAVSRTTYAALFAAYGTRYGTGDGATTFNLPNYKDYFLRGHDASGTDAGSRTNRGDGTTGANVGTKQADATKEHTTQPARWRLLATAPTPMGYHPRRR